MLVGIDFKTDQFFSLTNTPHTHPWLFCFLSRAINLAQGVMRGRMSNLRQNLERFFETGAFKRGVGYHTEGRVLRSSTFPDKRRVEGEVFGSRNSLYEVSVRLDWYRTKEIADIDGDCSCPIGYNCKHVVAVLLAQEQHLQNDNRVHSSHMRLTPVQTLSAFARNWMDRVENVAREAIDPEAYPASVKDRIAYILDRANDGSLHVDVVKTRVLKSGALSSTWRRYDGTRLSYGEPPKFIRPSDQMILQLLKHGGFSANPMRGPFGARLWSDILATGRAFWQDIDRALRQAASRWAEFEWISGEDGGQTIVVRDGAGHVLIPLGVSPPWFVDPTNGETGPLETSLDPTQAELLAGAPYLSSQDVSQIAPKLAAQNFIPLPVQIETVHHKDPPLAVLTLGVSHIPIMSARYGRYRYAYRDEFEDMLSLDLSFIYGDTRYASRELETMGLEFEAYSAGRRDVFHRDEDAELEAGDMLEAFAEGFGFTDPDDLHEIDPYGTATLPDFVLPGSTLGAFEEAAVTFLAEAVPRLRDAGWSVEIDDDWPAELITEPVSLSGGFGASADNLFELDLTGEAGDTHFDLAPILQQIILSLPPELLEAGNLEHHLSEINFYPALPDGRRITLPGRTIAPLVEAFRDLTGLGQLHVSEAGSAWKVAEALEGTGGTFSGLDKLKELASMLKRLNTPADVPVPIGVKAELRPYQRQGLGWLLALEETGFGGILADDMGLGKTLQALSLLMAKHGTLGGTGRPSLAVVPTSLLMTWKREAARFTPDLRVLILHGPKRAEIFDQIGTYDLVVTTYGSLRRDIDLLITYDFEIAILDEAQAVKNPRSATAKAVRQLSAGMRIALTGTPVENNLEELWAIMGWCCPGLLGNRTQFTETWRRPIERDQNTLVQRRLSTRLRPFMLRRRKDEVATDLPPKTEIVETVSMSPAQTALYDTIRLAMNTRVRDALQSKGLAASRITVLDALLKLRQAACDPALVKLPAARKVTSSAKRDRLVEMLEALQAEGRKVLIFSQFVEMLNLIEADVTERGWSFVKLTGQTRKRAEAVDQFQRGDANIFLVSLKAGGTGLTLTAADTVILYDPWWNPATERQAMDRAHRIGQDKPVFVYRLIAENTVEARIAQMQAQKTDLADAIFSSAADGKFQFSEADIMDLFA